MIIQDIYKGPTLCGQSAQQNRLNTFMYIEK